MAKEWQSDQARTRPSRLSWIALGAVAALTVMLMPLAGHAAPVNVAVLPANLGIIVAAELLTALLLLQQYVSGDRIRLFGFATAFLFSACMTASYAIIAPGLLTADGLFPEAPGVFSLLGTLSLAVFPISMALVLWSEPTAARWFGRVKQRGLFAIGGVVTTVLAALALVASVASIGVSTRDLDRFGTESLMSTGLGSWVVLVNVTAFVYVLSRSLRSREIERWISVATAACTAGTITSHMSSEPFSVGTYASQFLAVAAAVTVLLALVADISRMYRKAEADKHVLEDEALRLLRETRILQAREARVRRVVDSAADAYCELDLNGLLTYWNSKAATLFGLENSDGLSQQFVTALFDKTAARPLGSAIAILRHAGEDTEEFRLELTARGAGGATMPVEVTMWTHDTGEDRKVHVFVRDVTLQRQAETQLQRALHEERLLAQRLQELDRTKSDFVSSISHELRTPLTSTLGFLEILSDDPAGTLTDEQAYMVEIAERNGRRLLSLIEDLLTLSRIETGAFSVQYRPIEIASLIRQSVDDLRVAAEKQGVELRLQIDETELGLLPGDEHQMIKALGNVMENAVKFTPPGGSVDIAVRRDGETLSIIITDTGIGIPIEEQPQLFTRFFRSSVAVEQAHSGAGLGLPIARAVIEHHGGSIHINSSVETGTTVKIELPALGSVVS